MSSPGYTYGPKQWSPQGGMSRPWINEPLELSRATVTTGIRNDMPGFLPYVWNIGERLRRAQVAAELREARQRALEAIQLRPDPDTDPRAVAAAIERYGLHL